MDKFFSADQSQSHDLDEAEAKMRRALGGRLSAPGQHTSGQNHAGGHHAANTHGANTHGGSRPARRFVRDGEVETVIVNARGAAMGGVSGGRLREAEAALCAERLARQQAEHELREARLQIRTLQTQLAHAEMARTEALQKAEMPVVPELTSVVRAVPAPPERQAKAVAPKLKAVKQAPAEQENAGEQKPVEWWVPGWRDRL